MERNGKMGKILITASHYHELCADARELLESRGHELMINESALPYYTFQQLAEVVGNIDAAVVGLDEWTEEVFRMAPRLKVIAKFGVGTDNIDCDTAKEYGIKVINAPGQNSNAVAELTVGFMIQLLRNILPLYEGIRQGQWVRYIGGELKGKTVGLFGFGAVAKLVAKKLSSFETEVIACDLHPDSEYAKKYNVGLVSAEEVVERSDILSVHLPATSATYHLVDKAMISKMKRGACMINCARGAVVDTEALTEALKSGYLAGAALDAFETEPLPADSLLLTCDNVICTPHTGAETYEAYRNVSLCTAQGILDVLEGREPLYWVNRTGGTI
ncbi:phosphoglycerate dehydrogenase [[Clostridium] hylemonae]|uniref:4-phosphoerythronate dehydrogenase n=2 Tax=[Clostridium] hylemonae TaxID=89153 RepID=C0BYY9_9FIRM|nr:phosphoglycerate dehydrogenase [[Clostridium] hylemonae]EEG75067.1 4-phosphoerythronate dehydrogenase [[Clostridium] hylemonae DSM 15053]